MRCASVRIAGVPLAETPKDLESWCDMVEKQRQSLQALIERLLPHAGHRGGVECKHFFSGAAAYTGGRIFMTLTSARLALKLPSHRRVTLLEQGAKPLRYFPKAPIKKDYVVVPDNLVQDDDALTGLMQESLRYCGLPKVSASAQRRPRRK